MNPRAESHHCVGARVSQVCWGTPTRSASPDRRPSRSPSRSRSPPPKTTRRMPCNGSVYGSLVLRTRETHLTCRYLQTLVADLLRAPRHSGRSHLLRNLCGNLDRKRSCQSRLCGSYRPRRNADNLYSVVP